MAVIKNLRAQYSLCRECRHRTTAQNPCTRRMPVFRTQICFLLMFFSNPDLQEHRVTSFLDVNPVAFTADIF